MLIVGNKSDKGTPVRQDFSLQPEAFCARYKVKLKDISVIFYTLTLKSTRQTILLTDITFIYRYHLHNFIRPLEVNLNEISL